MVLPLACALVQPLDEANYQVLSDLANRTAQQMGYDDCFEACTRLKGAGWLMPD